MTKSDSIKIDEEDYDGEMHDPVLYPARKRAKVRWDHAGLLFHLTCSRRSRSPRCPMPAVPPVLRDLECTRWPPLWQSFSEGTPPCFALRSLSESGSTSRTTISRTRATDATFSATTDSVRSSTRIASRPSKFRRLCRSTWFASIDEAGIFGDHYEYSIWCQQICLLYF